MLKVISLSDRRWIRWAEKIGYKPIFVFKAAMNFISETGQEEQFEEYIKQKANSSSKASINH